MRHIKEADLSLEVSDIAYIIKYITFNGRYSANSQFEQKHY
jgi:hypothetical protein